MPRNLEIKAVFGSLSAARGIARKIGARCVSTMRQIDTYFPIRDGRLKVREIDRKRGELIYYRRSDRRNSRYSDYRVVPLEDRRALKDMLSSALGVKIVVRKKRTLFMFKNARIHLDVVEGLGCFIEFEVLVKYGRKQAEDLMRFLQREFNIQKKILIGNSYSDVLAAKR